MYCLFFIYIIINSKQNCYVNLKFSLRIYRYIDTPGKHSKQSKLMLSTKIGTFNKIDMSD